MTNSDLPEAAESEVSDFHEVGHRYLSVGKWGKLPNYLTPDSPELRDIIEDHIRKLAR